MSNPPSNTPRELPKRPNLRHLKEQAKDLLESKAASSLSNAQFQIARSYGFASWPKLKAHVERLEEAGQLKEAINRNDLALVQAMMTRNPALHQAPIGYGEYGPLTWVAECRVPRVAPDEVRLAMARWMIENGSEVHRGGDAPLMRAALDGERVPMMELLVAHGADVNNYFAGFYPILLASCEAMDPITMRWLLEHGADPNCGSGTRTLAPGVADPGTAVDYLLGAYGRDPEALAECLDLLLAAGGRSKHNEPAVIAVMKGSTAEVNAMLDAEADLIDRRFPALDFGTTAARMLTLKGGTLLHVAAEFRRPDMVELLIQRGADVNARALVDDSGVGGQTPLFHAATQPGDGGLAIVKYLVSHGADLTVRAKIPGHYEAPGQVVECTPLGYAVLFPGDGGPASAYLAEQGGAA